MSQTSDRELSQEIAALRDEIAVLNKHRFVTVQNNLWRLFAYRFAIGLFTGFGTVVGATVLVSVAIYWLQNIEWVPLIGDRAADIAAQMQQELEQVVPDAGGGAPGGQSE